MTNANGIPWPHDSVAPNDEELASTLDDERVASMADEGGFSGALMEVDDPHERKRLMRTRPGLRLRQWHKAAGAAALLGLAAWAVGWLWRRS